MRYPMNRLTHKFRLLITNGNYVWYVYKDFYGDKAIINWIWHLIITSVCVAAGAGVAADQW